MTKPIKYFCIFSSNQLFTDMYKFIFYCLLAFNLIFSQSVFGQVNQNSQWISGYVRTDGAYVKGYYRTESNNTINDNYSTYPNVNPYTGKKGYIKPQTNNNPIAYYPDYAAIAYKKLGLDKLEKKETFVYQPPSDAWSNHFYYRSSYPRYVIKSNANLRIWGNKNSNVIITMKKNDFIYVIPRHLDLGKRVIDNGIGESNNWSYVYYASGDVKGYVHNSLIVSYP